MNIEHDKQIPIKLPIFYKESIYSCYVSGGSSKTPKSTNDIRSQHIWGNRFIQLRGKTLFFKAWKDSYINFIDDLSGKNGNFLSGTKILDKLNLPFYPHHQYHHHLHHHHHSLLPPLLPFHLHSRSYFHLHAPCSYHHHLKPP